MFKRCEILPSTLIFLGVSVFSWLFFLPIFEAKASFGRLDKEVEFISPSVANLATALRGNFNLPSLPFASLLTTAKNPKEFYLSIPRLGISKALIIPNLDTGNPGIYLGELLRGVGHLKGSPFPGGGGNVFLFGHSSLPFLFDSGNYATIFSGLNKLKKGDGIELNFSGKNFFYRVEELKTVGPNSTIEELRTKGESLTILTCFPPGLLTERLIVKARPTSGPSYP